MVATLTTQDGLRCDGAGILSAISRRKLQKFAQIDFDSIIPNNSISSDTKLRIAMCILKIFAKTTGNYPNLLQGVGATRATAAQFAEQIPRAELQAIAAAGAAAAATTVPKVSPAPA